jgi:hypothetical protein
MGWFYGYEVAADQTDDAETRDVASILRRIVDLDPSALAVPRPWERKFVGHCRVTAVLLCSMLRAHGIPACARAGFSAYHGQSPAGDNWDHWICEYWDEFEERWVFVDPELDDLLRERAPADVSPFEVPRPRFISAGRAWLSCRRGGVDPAHFGFDPTNTGMSYIRGQLLRDLACFNKWEPAGSDLWGLAAVTEAALTPDDVALLDRVAAAIDMDLVAFEELRELYITYKQLRPLAELR